MTLSFDHPSIVKQNIQTAGMLTHARKLMMGVALKVIETTILCECELRLTDRIVYLQTKYRQMYLTVTGLTAVLQLYGSFETTSHRETQSIDRQVEDCPFSK